MKTLKLVVLALLLAVPQLGHTGSEGAGGGPGWLATLDDQSRPLMAEALTKLNLDGPQRLAMERQVVGLMLSEGQWQKECFHFTAAGRFPLLYIRRDACLDSELLPEVFAPSVVLMLLDLENSR